jgi:predicted nucleic acid-binding protein
MLLIDASVWVAFADETERFHGDARQLLDSTEDLATLDLALYEIANAVGVKKDRPQQARSLARLIERRCGESLVRADAEWTDSTLRFAAEHRLTAYDAAYVAAARRFGWTLVSADIKDLVAKGLAVAPDAAV